MRALVLGGGGAKGAFQAGAISYLFPKYQYDILCGVSVGAINAAFLSQFPISDSKQAAGGLTDLWQHIAPKDVIRLWYHGILWKIPAAWKPSVYDSRPLHAMLRSHLDPDKILNSGRCLRVGAVSLTTGSYTTWTEHDEDIVTGVAASSAFPVFMTPVEARGQLWVDGGARDITPVEDAIRAGATDIDVIQCDPNRPMPLTGRMTALKIAEASLTVAFLEIDKWDLKVTDMYNSRIPENSEKRVVKVRVLKPSHVLLEDSLDFDNGKARANFTFGLEAAINSGW